MFHLSTECALSYMDRFLNKCTNNTGTVQVLFNVNSGASVFKEVRGELVNR